MKKVRFQTPDKENILAKMSDSDCHSPRPFLERHRENSEPLWYDYPKVLVYSNDPVKRFECSNSSPYPLINKTSLNVLQDIKSKWSPSNELELSMLEASYHEPRQPIFRKSIEYGNPHVPLANTSADHAKALTSIENKPVPTSNVPKNNDFFIRRDNIGVITNQKMDLPSQFHRLSLDKENNPLSRKMEIMKMASSNKGEKNDTKVVEKRCDQIQVPTTAINDNCRCHHCILPSQNHNLYYQHQVVQTQNFNRTMAPRIACLNMSNQNHYQNLNGAKLNSHQCQNVPLNINGCIHCNCHTKVIPNTQNVCQCGDTKCMTVSPQNAIEKKTLAIEKYEKSKQNECTEIDKQTSVFKEKREPTVSDLFKIIKLQNEQLQMLQEKVDKFISASSQRQAPAVQNYVTEHVLENSEQHKISIGVMTSFEMVRTSTVINKEIVKQSENAQIQCNRSQISIKEVVSKSQPVNLNFLDGIMPVGNNMNSKSDQGSSGSILKENGIHQNGNANDEKTLNEISLYNVQVDNATTPLMSPEQTLYLDVRDYSDSDSGSDDQSNVGWTYYNKVMTHVNGMLQDSDMPSSASAMYRNTRQQCMQMHIDKTNVSVTKRVKFGDDPLGIHQPHLYAASTDTSMKMNQLAAKYLQQAAPVAQQTHTYTRQTTKPTTGPIDMSFATKNYMERHKLLQGAQFSSKSPPRADVPKFLDITALKQQPKLL